MAVIQIKCPRALIRKRQRTTRFKSDKKSLKTLKLLRKMTKGLVLHMGPDLTRIGLRLLSCKEKWSKDPNPAWRDKKSGNNS